MTLVFTVLIGLAVLSVLVIVHELGHFVTAKMSGVKVEEFGLGFPPKLLSIKRGETRYSLNAVPFGGFNKLAGEEDPNVKRSLASKGGGTRLLVLGAGSVMNLLLSILLFSITFMVPRDVITGQVIVEEVAPDSPAAVAGIEAGDIIISVNEKPVKSNSDLQRYIQFNLGKETAILIEHGDSTRESVRVVPRWEPPEGQGAIGIVIRTANATVIRQSDPFWRAVPLGIGKAINYLVLYKDGLAGIFAGEVTASFVGPVGVVQLTGEVAEAGIRPLLEVAALLSMLLCMFNLFPLPAIDGGRIVFVLLELVRRGRRVPARVERTIHMVGFALLIAFLLVITYQDILRLISGESLIR